MSFDFSSDDSDDLPDWLQGVDQPGDAAESPDSAGDQDMPDWLSGTGTSAAPASSDSAEDEDTPDWLSNILAHTALPSYSNNFSPFSDLMLPRSLIHTAAHIPYSDLYVLPYSVEPFLIL